MNEWERNMNIPKSLFTNVYIPEGSNELFLYSNVEDLLSNTKDIETFVERFLNVEVPRLKILESYANGKNYGIMHRLSRKNRERADYRVAHNFGGYISKINTGYLFGIPVKVTNKKVGSLEDEEKDGNINDEEADVLKEVSEVNNIDELNSSLGYDCSVYGRAFELHYRNEDDEDKISKSSVFETFMIYDNTVERRPIMAVRCPRYVKDEKEIINIELYTKDAVYYCKETTTDNVEVFIDEEKTQENIREEIQIIDWFNNETRTGDFEEVLTLIDLYDFAQADTANYMTDFNEALLVISGDLDSTGLKYDKDANMLILKSGVSVGGGGNKIDANYIYKQYDVAGTEAYKKRLETDIHKYTLTPSLDDESFSQVASGEAQKYKLWGVEQLRSTKESYYKKAIKKRYGLINAVKSKVSEFFVDPKDLQIEFTENVPKDYWSEVKSFVDSGGELSKSTLISLLSWVDDVKDELDKLEFEKNGEEEELVVEEVKNEGEEVENVEVKAKEEPINKEVKEEKAVDNSKDIKKEKVKK
ncbi:phage portal protein [Miniphocaeibacter massiliensis]|uniref:phage portal protein n=1 Tax=Miniphocaeibacter massiliensis TaxID=2041841 RepID=UPI00101AD085|nr:phage portal protein [Miniphocaeibacter massiliensis]